EPWVRSRLSNGNVLSSRDADEGLLSDGNERSFGRGAGENLKPADGQCAARLDHAPDGLEVITARGIQQIEFELNRQDRTVSGKQGEPRIAARRVRDRRGCTGVEEPMLLR